MKICLTFTLYTSLLSPLWRDGVTRHPGHHTATLSNMPAPRHRVPVHLSRLHKGE